MNAPAFPARAAADPCLINLDMLVCATANAIPIGANHSGAQLVEELKGGLVAREAELPLELDRGYAGSLAGDEIGGPKPDGQRRAAALHDRADSQSCLASALAACQHARTARNAERFAVRVAARADEAALPARLLEICGAGRIVGEEPLKLRQRPGIRQRRALLHIHYNGRRRSHCPIQPRRKALADRRPAGPSAPHYPLALAGVCVNRIGMEQGTGSGEDAPGRGRHPRARQGVLGPESRRRAVGLCRRHRPNVPGLDGRQDF